jgi:hypothetical protein
MRTAQQRTSLWGVPQVEPATATAQFRMPTSFDAPHKARPRKCPVMVPQTRRTSSLDATRRESNHSFHDSNHATARSASGRRLSSTLGSRSWITPASTSPASSRRPNTANNAKARKSGLTCGFVESQSCQIIVRWPSGGGSASSNLAGRASVSPSYAQFRRCFSSTTFAFPSLAQHYLGACQQQRNPGARYRRQCLSSGTPPT